MLDAVWCSAVHCKLSPLTKARRGELFPPFETNFIDVVDADFWLLPQVGAAGKANVGFAYDKAKDTYHFCFAQGAVDEKIGYPTICEENGAVARLRRAFRA